MEDNNQLSRRKFIQQTAGEGMLANPMHIFANRYNKSFEQYRKGYAEMMKTEN